LRDVNLLTDADAHVINIIADMVHANARDKGFWDGDEHNIPEKLALIHSEISEALEAWRTDKLASDKHIPDYPNFDVELADAVIRIFDLAAYLHIDIGNTIRAKHAFNRSRAYKHGKKF